MGWVTDRYRCTLDIAFADLRDAVKADVAEANGLLSEDRRRTGNFLVDQGNSPSSRFLVRGYPIRSKPNTDEEKVWFEILGDTIRVLHVRGREDITTTVCQRWDTVSASCTLHIGSRRVTVAEISQLALEPLFFGKSA